MLHRGDLLDKFFRQSPQMRGRIVSVNSGWNAFDRGHRRGILLGYRTLTCLVLGVYRKDPSGCPTIVVVYLWYHYYVWATLVSMISLDSYLLSLRIHIYFLNDIDLNRILILLKLYGRGMHWVILRRRIISFFNHYDRGGNRASPEFLDYWRLRRQLLLLDIVHDKESLVFLKIVELTLHFFCARGIVVDVIFIFTGVIFPTEWNMKPLLWKMLQLRLFFVWDLCANAGNWDLLR